ncbi:MAG: hypothetical protein KC621_30555, partial [Myxococcales bacterium]|nr:hypothetical protein [Myxococcales bacterium]
MLSVTSPLRPPGHARRIVVTGLGCVGPCGNDVASTWSAMVEARSGIGLVSKFDASEMP